MRVSAAEVVRLVLWLREHCCPEGLEALRQRLAQRCQQVGTASSPQKPLFPLSAGGGTRFA